MYLPSLHGAFFYTWEEDFSIQSLCLAAGGGPGVGVVNVSRQIASNLDAYGNWIYTDAIYCSYSFKADDAEYYGEQLTRIDAFTFGEVQSICIASTNRRQERALSAARPNAQSPSAIVDNRGQCRRHGPRLDVSTKSTRPAAADAALRKAPRDRFSTEYSDHEAD